MGKVAVKPKKKLDSAARERLQLAKKLSRLRKRERGGGGLTDDERALLAAHPKKVAGRPTAEESEAKAAEPEIPPNDGVNAVGAGDIDDAEPDDGSEAPPPPPRFDPPSEPPPKVRAGAPRGKGDWRDKYRSAGHGGDDREATCVLASNMLVVLPMRRAMAYVASTGAPPIFSEQFIGEVLFKLGVRVADKYIPDSLALSEEMELGALAATGLGQALACYFKQKKGARPEPGPKRDAPTPPPPGNERPAESKPANGAPPNPVVDAPQLPAGRFEVKPDTYI